MDLRNKKTRMIRQESSTDIEMSEAKANEPEIERNKEINLYSDDSAISIESEIEITNEQELFGRFIPVNIIDKNSPRNKVIKAILISENTHEEMKRELTEKRKAGTEIFGSRKKEKIVSISKEEKKELFGIIEKGSIDQVKEFIKEKSIKNIDNVRDDNNNTLLHIAAEENRLEMLQLLIEEYKGDINAKNKYDLSVLHSVASGIVNRRGDWKIMEWILQRGKIETEVETKGGLTVEDIFISKDASLADHYEDLVDKFSQKKQVEQNPKF